MERSLGLRPGEINNSGQLPGIVNKLIEIWNSEPNPNRALERELGLKPGELRPMSNEESEHFAEVCLKILFIGPLYTLSTGESLITGEEASKLKALVEIGEMAGIYYTIGQIGDMSGKVGEVGEIRTANKANIPEAKVNEIISTPKYSRPDPTTYLSEEYILDHTAKFNNGVTKFCVNPPSGYAGPPGGTYVMPSSMADELIFQAGGDISKLEKLLGLEVGSLGSTPVRVDIIKPSGLRMPSGNEFGTNTNWLPGGFTSGGIPEIIIESPALGDYTIKPIK